MEDEDLNKKNELERKMERKIDHLIMLGVVILLLVVIVIGILIRTSPFW
jgi:predicted nucleic acid-binding Zn ribbon protein